MSWQLTSITHSQVILFVLIAAIAAIAAVWTRSVRLRAGRAIARQWAAARFLDLTLLPRAGAMLNSQVSN